MDYPCAKFLAILVLTVLVLSCEHTDRQTDRITESLYRGGWSAWV